MAVITEQANPTTEPEAPAAPTGSTVTVRGATYELHPMAALAGVQAVMVLSRYAKALRPWLESINQGAYKQADGKQDYAGVFLGALEALAPFGPQAAHDLFRLLSLLADIDQQELEAAPLTEALVVFGAVMRVNNLPGLYVTALGA